MACLVCKAASAPTHVVAEVPGGQLRGAMADLMPAEQFADLGHARLLRGGGQRQDFVLDRRPRHRIAVIQADRVEFRLSHGLWRDAEHHRARPTADPLRRLLVLFGGGRDPVSVGARSHSRNGKLPDLGQHGDAGERGRQFDRQRLVGLVGDQQPALQFVAWDESNVDLLLLNCREEFHFFHARIGGVAASVSAGPRPASACRKPSPPPGPRKAARAIHKSGP